MGREGRDRRNILVTGGAGYIGSHACKHLSSSGFTPVAYDDLSTGNRSAVCWGPLVVGDIADAGRLQETISQFQIDSVLHFAASAYVGESVVNPRKYFQNNIAKTIEMLNVLLDSNVRHVVFSSTCATYGNPRYLPIDEDHPQAPVNPYGESKLSVEKILRWYGKCYGLRWVVLRYFNVAGADLQQEIGESHPEETHLIPLALRSLALDGPALKIFGADYPTLDGTAVRDFIHVADISRAHGLALGYLWSGSESRAFNLGSGRGYSVQEVIRAIEEISGRKARFIQHPRRDGDPAELVASAALAQRELGWLPELSDLQTIVHTAYAWMMKQAPVEELSSLKVGV